jgi:ABC-type phosphate transport system substrate-binding protein
MKKRRNKNSLVGIAAMALTLLVSGGARADSPEDILVFVNLRNKIGNASPVEIKDIFLKKRANWSQGSKVVPVHAPSGSLVRDAFRQRVLSMEEFEEQNYWQDGKLRHGLEPPVSFGNPIRAVFRLDNGVGYCFRADYVEGVVNVVLVIPHDNKSK